MSNNKAGFAYYNVDTDRYQDIKIKRLKKDFGGTGIAVYDYILCEIYRVKGCFIAWDESTAFDVAEYFGLKETLVKEIVNYCCVVGLFDRELLIGENVITSLSIQSRYVEMCNRAKRKEFKIPEEYAILPEQSPKLTEESLKKDAVCRKVEKSRVKENKREREKEKTSPPIPDILNLSEKSLEDCFNELKTNQSWKETLCMNTRIRDKTFMPADFDQYLKQFFRKLANEGETKKAPKDAMSHFARWLDIELRNKSNEKSAIKNQRDSEQRKADSFTAITTTVTEAAARRRAELEAEGII